MNAVDVQRLDYLALLLDCLRSSWIQAAPAFCEQAFSVWNPSHVHCPPLATLHLLSEQKAHMVCRMLCVDGDIHHFKYADATWPL